MKGLSTFQPSESNVPNEPDKALLRITQDIARVLDGLHECIKSYLVLAVRPEKIQIF